MLDKMRLVFPKQTALVGHLTIRDRIAVNSLEAPFGGEGTKTAFAAMRNEKRQDLECIAELKFTHNKHLPAVAVPYEGSVVLDSEMRLQDGIFLQLLGVNCNCHTFAGPRNHL